MVSLYRRFRPDTFDKVIGQSHIINTLKNQIKLGRISHAYLFTGTRGTGKTSTAKIFARAVNCTNNIDGNPCGQCAVCKALKESANLDVVEMDAASNNSVDDIRDLKDAIQYGPTIGKYKVYIIDEVHMLSPSAFNALLKTLEEPPEYAIFILATTEIHKVPRTILSRCERFDFRLVSEKTLAKHLRYIFDEIGAEAEDKALTLIARHGEGSVRDSISLADMLISYKTGILTAEDVENALGLTSFDLLYSTAEAILIGDIASIMRLSTEIVDDGKNITNFAKDLMRFMLNLISVTKLPKEELDLTDEEYDDLKTLAKKTTDVRITKVIEILSKLEASLRLTTQPQIIFTAVLVEAASPETDLTLEGTLTRIRLLEKRVNEIYSGAVSVSKATKDGENATQEESDSIKMLKQNCQKDEENLVPDEKALECWKVVGSILKQDREFALSGIVNVASTVQFEDGVLEFFTKDPGILSLLADEYYFNKLRDAAMSAGAKDFKVNDLRKKRTEASESRQNRLAELFGAKKGE